MKTHPAMLPIATLLASCDIKRTRRGGPGGQHRNKVESALVITHRPTGIIGQAGERRSQHANREVAIQRLRENLAIQIRGECSIDQVPTELWQSRQEGRKIGVNPQHVDYPALLAEALDGIAAHAFEVGNAARQLGVSTSQLIKLIQGSPQAFEWVNQKREELGMGRLR